MKIQLSEAILLGSTKYKSESGSFFSNDISGVKSACALGMAIGAVGRESDALNCCGTLLGLSWSNPSLVISDEWPWLENKCTLPCPVCTSDLVGISCSEDVEEDAVGWDWDENDDYGAMIIHIFDNHVGGLHHQWTLEQLVDWVKLVEPPVKGFPASLQQPFRKCNFSAEDAELINQ